MHKHLAVINIAEQTGHKHPSYSCNVIPAYTYILHIAKLDEGSHAVLSRAYSGNSEQIRLLQFKVVGDLCLHYHCEYKICVFGAASLSVGQYARKMRA